MTNPEMKRRRAPSFKVYVDVTAELIDKAVRRDSYGCWVSEAVKVAFPNAVNVKTDLQWIRVSDHVVRLRYLFPTPRVCQIALIDFDRGRRPEPFGFKLTKPAMITRGRGPAVERTPEEKAEKHREQQRKYRAAQRTYRASLIDEPFAPPVEATHEVKKAMEEPFTSLGPTIALEAAGAAGTGSSVEVIVGGNPPPYRRVRRARNDGSNIMTVRRFGVRDLIE